RDPDAEHAGTPLHEAPDESGPIGREQQRGKDSGHEEDERVQQGQDAEASGRLAEQIDRESRRDRASGGITRVRVHEGDVLVHAGALTGAGYRRSSRALLSTRSVKSSRSWVSASSWRRAWTPRSTSSSGAVTSADADCGPAARRRASLRTVTAGIPTNIRRAVRNTAGSKWLSSFVRFLIYVLAVLHHKSRRHAACPAPSRRGMSPASSGSNGSSPFWSRRGTACRCQERRLGRRRSSRDWRGSQQAGLRPD